MLSVSVAENLKRNTKIFPKKYVNNTKLLVDRVLNLQTSCLNQGECFMPL